LVTGPRLIVIAIMVQSSAGTGPPHVHVNILGGISVPLIDAQYHQAIDVFNQAVQTGAYTQATLEAIQTLHTQGA